MICPKCLGTLDFTVLENWVVFVHQMYNLCMYDKQNTRDKQLFFSILFLSHRTLVYRPTCLCALSPACWSRSSPSCCWRESPSSAHHRTCATYVMRYSKTRMRKRHGSTSCSRLLYVSKRAGLFRLTGGSTWWLASSKLKDQLMGFWCLMCCCCFFPFGLHSAFICLLWHVLFNVLFKVSFKKSW